MQRAPHFGAARPSFGRTERFLLNENAIPEKIRRDQHDICIAGTGKVRLRSVHATGWRAGQAYTTPMP